MLRALTLINRELRFVGERKALNHGHCYFCGHALKNHPKTGGRILINRHHRIGSFLQPIYPVVTGTAYPKPEANLFWAGTGCHMAFHRDLDYRVNRAETRIVHRITQQWVERPNYHLTTPERQGLRAFLSRFTRQMEDCNYGELSLSYPVRP